MFGSDSETSSFSSCSSSPSVNRRVRSSSAIPRPQSSAGSTGGIRSLFLSYHRCLLFDHQSISAAATVVVSSPSAPFLFLHFPLFLFHRLSFLWHSHTTYIHRPIVRCLFCFVHSCACLFFHEVTLDIHFMCIYLSFFLSLSFLSMT